MRNFISFFNLNLIKQETQLQLGNRHKTVSHGPQECETKGQNFAYVMFITQCIGRGTRDELYEYYHGETEYQPLYAYSKSNCTHQHNDTSSL